MNLKRNWEIRAGLWTKIKNLYKKGGLNPSFYLYRYQFNAYPEKFRVGRYPLDVIAEACNICNLRCTMCFQVDKDLPVPGTTKVPFMSMETFRRIADECAANRVPALKLSWRGEPMLNKNFADMVHYAKSKGILEVTSLTNATLMDEHMCRALVRARLDQIVISIDGFSKEIYERIRVGADYDTVVGNIHRLISIRGRANKPFIRLQYTESDVNRHETQRFYEYWNRRADEISISYCQDFSSPDKEKPEEVPKHDFFCKQPFQRLVIMTDGSVGVCATDVMGAISIGNIHQETLHELWHGERIRAHREIHRTGKYYINPMCRICAHNTFKANERADRTGD